MKIAFTKMHGLGNDFMVINGIEQAIDLSPEQIQQLADRHTGVGFDQLLLVEAPQTPAAEFRYRIFNADGSEVEQCGNGARCFAVFVRDAGLTEHRLIPVETMGGLIRLQVEDNGDVTVDMGEPNFRPESLPFINNEDAVVSGTREPGHYKLKLNQHIYTIDIVSMGNPHAVLQVDDIENTDVAATGALIGADSHFPQGVNVGFMQIVNRHTIRLRVYERGAGETLACGTGASAAVAVGIRRGLLDNDVKVPLSGGELRIAWAGEGCSLFMTGPVSRVYRGETTG